MKHGFTIVEMLAATALSAVLFVVMFILLSGFGREQRAAMIRARADTMPQVTDLLRWDLVNARQVQCAPGQVMLDGFGALDRESLDASWHRPVDVTYEVRQAGGKPWLVRRQQEKDGSQKFTELVCGGVSGLRVIPLAITDGPEPPVQPLKGPTAVMPMPGRLRLQIQWKDQQRAAFDEVLVLR